LKKIKSLNDFLLQIEESKLLSPIYFLEEGEKYQYLGSGDLFSRSFVFEVIRDNPEYYDILIEDQIPSKLIKDYNFIDYVNQGNIYPIKGLKPKYSQSQI